MNGYFEQKGNSSRWEHAWMHSVTWAAVTSSYQACVLN